MDWANWLAAYESSPDSQLSNVLTFKKKTKYKLQKEAH